MAGEPSRRKLSGANGQACGTGYQGSFHDEAGTPLVNKTKFPSLKDLVTYGHSK